MAKVPQDVTREDRLIGPLTLKQFLFILGGGSVTFIAYQYYLQRYLYPIEFGLIGLVAISLSLAFAFAHINGLSFAAFMSHAIAFLFAPKKRRWVKDREEVLEISDANNTGPVSGPITNTNSKTTNVSQLELLAKVLDTGGRMDENNANANRIGNISSETITVAEPIVDDVLGETDN